MDNLLQLLFLDLSAAFDKVDHHILLNRCLSFSFAGTVLKWLESDLHDRSQCVKLLYMNILPGLFRLPFSVPQGYMLGSVLFSLYTNPLGGIIQKHSLQYISMQMTPRFI